METCGMNFIKYMLFIFNLIFAISGIGIIVAGAVVLADVSDINHFVNSDLLGPPIVLIITGAIVFAIASLGCFGAIRESYNMLLAFAVALVIVFLLELAAGIAAAVYKSDFQEALKTTLRNSMNKYSDENTNNDKIAWDNVQKKMKCCGVDGPGDWQGQKTPFSCCTYEQLPQDVEQFCSDNGVGAFIYKTGCYEKLQMKIQSNTKILIGVGIGIAFVEIIGIILACWLAYTIKQEQSEK